MGQVLKLTADPAELRLMRAFVSHWAERRGLSEADAFAACLVATEAVSNAIRHAGGDAPITVSCRLNGTELEIEVEDEGRFDAATPAVHEGPGPDDPGGRGLFLIQELTRAFELEKRDTGTRVCMRLGVEPSHGFTGSTMAA